MFLEQAMRWIALSPREDERTAWGWRALHFTPRVALLDESLVLEVSGSERLWGGVGALLRHLLEPDGLTPCNVMAQGRTALVALALLRLKHQGQATPAEVPDGLPLSTLSAAVPHVDLLERTGCRSWAELRALPRGGVARRFGAALLDALDTAYGDQPEQYHWLTLPEVFDQNLELPALATTAPELMWTAQRLLAQLQAWLRGRQRGVLAFELEWTHDLRRLDGVMLPRQAQLAIRTAQPTQDMAHLRRLAGEHLDRTQLAAPVNHLRLRTLATAPWAGANTSLLPEDQVKGERLHQLIERLGARLQPHNVLVPVLQADHRPEKMQCWVPAHEASSATTQCSLPPFAGLYPPWLLPEPVPLQMEQGQPVFRGPLQMLTRPHRMESLGWWDLSGGKPAFRNYYIALSAEAGLLWIYCEMPRSAEMHARWFLQGVYA